MIIKLIFQHLIPGFFCRDPDTGMLHPVNSTWPSSSFCGKYHCRLRRKNITATGYAPMREINITNMKLYNENFTKEHIQNETNFNNKEKVEETVITTDKKTEPDITDETLVRKIIPIGQTIGLQIDEKIVVNNDTERDRYLTDIEIKSISEILHTVKKSDLDAIVEIYNLAQDIYKEIGNTSTNHVSNEALHITNAVNSYKTKPVEIEKTVKKNNRVSYWYEPLSNGKVRPGDLIRTDMTRTETMRNDMNPVIPALPADMQEQSSNMITVAHTTTTKPKTPPTLVTLPPSSNQRRMTATYFSGPLSHKDFGKLPYYYPISNFQRSSSYLHQQDKIPPKPTFKPITYKPQVNNGGVYQKEIKPSILLPYPFSYIHHYNWSYPQNGYNTNNNVELSKLRAKENIKVESKNVYQSNNNLEQSKFRSKENIKIDSNNFVPKIRKAVLMNPDLENFQDLEIKAMRDIEDKTPVSNFVNKVKEENRRPEWQTDPIPNQILEEVRAHLLEKQRLLKPFQLRKKVKLERVGKLIKLDELTRSKRLADSIADKSDYGSLEPELYEVYIERTT